MKLSFLTTKEENNNRKRTYTREGKIEKIFQFHKIAAKEKKMMATVFEFHSFQFDILYYRLHNICVTCLGFDLLSDLWT